MNCARNRGELTFCSDLKGGDLSRSDHIFFAQHQVMGIPRKRRADNDNQSQAETDRLFFIVIHQVGLI